MDFAYTREEEAFRQELRVWLEPNVRAHREQWGKDESVALIGLTAYADGTGAGRSGCRDAPRDRVR